MIAKAEVRSQKSEVRSNPAADPLRSPSSFAPCTLRLAPGYRSPLPPSAFRLPSFFRGFSLVELLVVIGIIVLLIGILLPALSGVRKAGMKTKSAALISNLGSAVQRYYQEFGAYPGPVKNDSVYGIPGVANTNPTMAENLVLGLSGGLEATSTSGVIPATVAYNPDLVKTGPRCLNGAVGKWNRQYPPFIEGVPLSSGKFVDDASTPGGADDTNIPEFLDGYGDPLPILYLRANTGIRSNRALTAQRDRNNDVCTAYLPSASNSILGQYDVSQLIPYTNTAIGVGKDASKGSKYVNSGNFPAHGLRSVQPNLLYSVKNPPPAGLTYAYPYDAYALLGSPSFLNTSVSPPKFTEPRQRDGFILIGAGPDRIYGTEDDIYSFGSLE